MMRNRMLYLVLAVLLCMFPVSGVLASDIAVDEEETELSETVSEEEEASSETVSEDESEPMREMTDEANEDEEEIEVLESEQTDLQDDGEDTINEEMTDTGEENMFPTESESFSEDDFDENDGDQEEDMDVGVLYNVFCVNTINDEVTEVQEDETIVLEEEMEVDDFVSAVTGDDEYRFHSVGEFYHMDGEDFANNLVPEFYMDTDDFWEFDEEAGSFLFTSVPPEDVSIVFYIISGTSSTMMMDVNAELTDVVPVQTQEQLLRPVATGVMTDAVPFLVIGGFGLVGLASRLRARRKESL